MNLSSPSKTAKDSFFVFSMASHYLHHISMNPLFTCPQNTPSSVVRSTTSHPKIRPGMQWMIPGIRAFEQLTCEAVNVSYSHTKAIMLHVEDLLQQVSSPLLRSLPE